MQRTVYSSTVVGRAHLAVGLALSAVVGAGLFGRVPAWGLALTVLVCVLVTAHLSMVRMTADADRIVVGLGPWGRGRVIPTSAVHAVATEDLSWPQVFGIGVATRWRTTRLTVRPGPTLRLELDNRERVRISTSDPAAAQHALAITEGASS